MAKGAKEPPYVYDAAHYRIVFKELLNGSDKATAVVGAAMVDDALEKMLQFRLTKANKGAAARLLARGGAIDTLSTRIDMCAVLGIIGPKTCDDLHLIRDVRNKFAHRLLLPDAQGSPASVSFETPQIVKWCQSLLLPTKAFGDKASKDPKQKYAQACLYAATVLLNAVTSGGPGHAIPGLSPDALQT